MTSTGTSSTTSDRQKLLKFVELLVHDYLQARGFEDTGVKFAAECSKSLPVANDDHAESGTCKDESPVADEVDSWYYLANKLALPVRTSECVARHKLRITARFSSVEAPQEADLRLSSLSNV